MTSHLSSAGLENELNAEGEIMAENVIEFTDDNFDDEVVNRFVLSLFDSQVFTEKGGKPRVVDFSTHFAGKVVEMWKVVAFILETNLMPGESLRSSSPTTEKESLTEES